MEEKQILEVLNYSAEEVIKRNRAGYYAIYALLITWQEKDDEGIDAEVGRLRNILENIGATVDHYQIPSEYPQIDIQQTFLNIYSTYQDIAKDWLFVLYYSGHGDQGGDEKRSHWTA